MNASRAALFSAITALLFGLGGCGEREAPEAETVVVANLPEGGNAPEAGNLPAEGNTPAGNAPDGSAAPAGNAPAAETAPAKLPSQATIVTSRGTIEVDLYEDKAPITVENFAKYARSNHYANTIFHRVIPDFMIQGGGFTPGMEEKPTGAPIRNEATNNLENERGTLAMARTSDPDSATSQFFINLKDNEFLNRNEAQGNYGYAVFGKVTKGMDVVDKIAQVQTTAKGMHENVPVDPVIIKSVTVK